MANEILTFNSVVIMLNVAMVIKNGRQDFVRYNDISRVDDNIIVKRFHGYDFIECIAAITCTWFI